MKIGILVTNTDDSDFAKAQPRDGEKFTRLMQAVRPGWDYVVYDCVKGEFPSHANECDGYIIGGSPASVNDSAPWIAQLFYFIRSLNTLRHPMAGCCFGHQAIAKALGGTVGKNPGGWGFGVAPTAITAPQIWMQPPAQQIDLYAAHTEQVLALPMDANAYGGSAFCPVGGFVIGDHVMTTEYHPEMTKEFFLGLTHAFEKYIGSEVAFEARRQAGQKAQGPLFAEWMARFFELRAAAP